MTNAEMLHLRGDLTLKLATLSAVVNTSRSNKSFTVTSHAAATSAYSSRASPARTNCGSADTSSAAEFAESCAERKTQGRWLITLTRGMNAPRLWDLTAAKPTAAPIVLEDHGSEVNNQILLSPDRRWLATSYRDATVSVWDLNGQDAIGNPLVLDGINRVTTLYFSSDSRWLLAHDHDAKNTHVWNLTAADSPEVATVVEGALRRISPDSRWFVAGKKLWSLAGDTPTAMPIALDRLGEPWWSAEFSANGRRLALYSTTNVRLFDLSVSKPAAASILLTGALRKHTQFSPRRSLELLPMPFSADGNWLVGCNFTGSGINSPNTLLFNLRIHELVKVARRTAGRELTDEERSLFSLTDLH